MLHEGLQKDEEHLMRIGEIADFFNLSQKAIRLYEKKGIIKPARIDQMTGYRYYTVDQVQQLNALIELKSLGFSLNEIKKIMEGGISAKKLMEGLAEKKKAWQEAIMAAENKIDAIDSIADRLRLSKEAAGFQELTQEQRAWLLVKMVCVEDLRAQHLLSEALWL
jgi:DNA-binding transcriptional MerR regulator